MLTNHQIETKQLQNYAAELKNCRPGNKNERKKKQKNGIIVYQI